MDHQQTLSGLLKEHSLSMSIHEFPLEVTKEVPPQLEWRDKEKEDPPVFILLMGINYHINENRDSCAAYTNKYQILNDAP